MQRPSDLPAQPLAHSASPHHQQPVLSLLQEEGAPESRFAEPFLQEKPPAHALGPSRHSTGDPSPRATDLHLKSHVGDSVSDCVRFIQQTHGEDPHGAKAFPVQGMDQGTQRRTFLPDIPGEGGKCRSQNVVADAASR